MAKVNDTYDIGAAFEAVENELIASMIRNMKSHRIEEIDEDKEWEMWQVLQLKSLEQYKRRNAKRFQGKFREINGQIDSMIHAAKQRGGMEQEIKILNAIKKGFRPSKKRIRSTDMTGEFFKLNDRKLEALIKATQNDFEKAETAVLRMANDQYRKIIFNAQVYANTGAGTYEKAVDMATKDFLSRGINCIEYANGARHTIKDYSSMAIQTACKRAYLQGEGEMRKEWGITTVIMNKRSMACPKCIPFAGKILIDDVWSGGKASDGPYMLMSSAIAAGLYHPRCRDIHTTYYEGISTAPDSKFTRLEIKEIEDNYRADQKQQYAKRQADRFGRLTKFSLDEDNQERYRRKENEWKQKYIHEQPIQKNESNYNSVRTEYLDSNEKGALIKYISPDAYLLNDKIRRDIGLTENEKDWIINLDKALDKMPEYVGTVYRSVSGFGIDDIKAFIDSHVVGGRKLFPSYLSTSLDVYDKSFPVQYVIKSKHGKNISGYNQSEKEILFKRNSRFLITKVRGNTIWMEEI